MRLKMAITIPFRFEPSRDTLAALNAGGWDASYSGGKDSTALVTYIEALRRCGLATCERPSLTMSDTGVEYPFLRDTSAAVMNALRSCGWECIVVKPAPHQRLYCQIFGRGLPPIHPGIRRTRWCTRSTKQDPINARFEKGRTPLKISGVRWGESDMRDGKLVAMGCAAGGECGLPNPGEGVFSPIITWRTCKVVEWLSGQYEGSLRERMSDLIQLTKTLVDIYDFKPGARTFTDETPPLKSLLRFGCMGCPAIQKDKVLSSSAAKRTPRMQKISQLYGIWEELWKPKNRLAGMRRGKPVKGPIRMEARKQYYAEVLRIQAEAGVTLVTDEDDAFIRQCWVNEVYPRGWKAVDEDFVAAEVGLFAAV